MLLLNTGVGSKVLLLSIWVQKEEENLYLFHHLFILFQRSCSLLSNVNLVKRVVIKIIIEKPCLSQCHIKI